MVALSNRLAAEAGVTGKATFIEGDMFTADISKATVMALFLLPTNLERLRDTFYTQLRPGTRMVLNTFAHSRVGRRRARDHRRATASAGARRCSTSCRRGSPGPGRRRAASCKLTQSYQVVMGTLTADGKAVQVTGKLRGTELTLDADGMTLAGTVNGDRIEGQGWSASRVSP